MTLRKRKREEEKKKTKKTPHDPHPDSGQNCQPVDVTGLIEMPILDFLALEAGN
ncbi:hypothetical protein PDE_09127 [Penicillium oxalicum 114-2]|uniref:Uncharacterized protein n=1 Tax=Penicillium oxalicum (strain 114-2 / CGMCC 5302) TaxID=933388 RepID=S8B5M2_PENO1|nr:hypothetical protein PDE_09127 [Penicillium oxalicum 114-2]